MVRHASNVFKKFAAKKKNGGDMTAAASPHKPVNRTGYDFDPVRSPCPVTLSLDETPEMARFVILH